MAINISDKPEINVVNVGDEITTDQLAAITGANSPSSANHFATMGDVGGGGFDQSLNTTDGVTFASAVINNTTGLAASGSGSTFVYGQTLIVSGNESDGSNDGTITLNGGYDGSSYWRVVTISTNGITFQDGSFQSTAASSFDQSLNTTDNVTFYQASFPDASSTYIATLDHSGLNIVYNDGVNPPTSAGFGHSGIGFSDGTSQTSAPVVSTGTILTGGTADLSSADYPDEITIVINGVTYAMPARVVSL